MLDSDLVLALKGLTVSVALFFGGVGRNMRRSNSWEL